MIDVVAGVDGERDVLLFVNVLEVMVAAVDGGVAVAVAAVAVAETTVGVLDAADGHPEHEGDVDVIANRFLGVSRGHGAGNDVSWADLPLALDLTVLTVVHKLLCRHLRDTALLHSELTHVQHGTAPGGMERGVHGGGVGEGEGGHLGEGVGGRELWPQQGRDDVGRGGVV